MKINRIDVLIRRIENKHKPYLDNNIMKLMADYKFGGLYTKDFIQLNTAPETITTSVKIELSLADHTNIHQEITYSFIRYNMAYDKRKLIGNVGKFKLSNK